MRRDAANIATVAQVEPPHCTYIQLDVLASQAPPPSARLHGSNPPPSTVTPHDPDCLTGVLFITLALAPPPIPNLTPCSCHDLLQGASNSSEIMKPDIRIMLTIDASVASSLSRYATQCHDTISLHGPLQSSQNGISYLGMRPIPGFTSVPSHIY